jgi:tetratricopeptide (TPR) repeat protein
MQRATDAERSYREALRLSAATRGPDHPDVAERRFLLGRVVIAQGRPDEAVEHFTDAERILLVRSAPPDALARTRWALARAQVETGAVAEAIENARAARADFLAAKDSAEVDAIDRFIAQQGPPAGSTGHGRP